MANYPMDRDTFWVRKWGCKKNKCALLFWKWRCSVISIAQASKCSVPYWPLRLWITLWSTEIDSVFSFSHLFPLLHLNLSISKHSNGYIIPIVHIENTFQHTYSWKNDCAALLQSLTPCCWEQSVLLFLLCEPSTGCFQRPMEALVVVACNGHKSKWLL